MLEKNGKFLLTEEDIKEYQRGTVSARIQELWGLHFDELHDIITTANYVLLPNREDNNNHGN